MIQFQSHRALRLCRPQTLEKLIDEIRVAIYYKSTRSESAEALRRLRTNRKIAAGIIRLTSFSLGGPFELLEMACF